MAYVKVRLLDNLVKIVKLYQSEGISIGRGDYNDIVLHDAACSRHHAVINMEGGLYVLEDCLSSLGTFLNGQKVKTSPLVDQDVIQVGNCEIVFFTHEYQISYRNLLNLEKVCFGKLNFEKILQLSHLSFVFLLNEHSLNFMAALLKEKLSILCSKEREAYQIIKLFLLTIQEIDKHKSKRKIAFFYEPGELCFSVKYFSSSLLAQRLQKLDKQNVITDCYTRYLVEHADRIEWNERDREVTFYKSFAAQEQHIQTQKFYPALERLSFQFKYNKKIATHKIYNLLRHAVPDRYQIIEVLGEGGMGTVFRAQDMETQECVAIKTLSAQGGNNPALAKKRLQQEALLLKQMNSPAVVKIFDAQEAPNGVFYIVMEYVPGKNLRHWLTNNALSLEKIIAISYQLICILEETHRKGVIHRDLKPENVIVWEKDNKPHVKLIDFGIAKALQELDTTESITNYTVGMAVGTLHYMSPEQIDAEEITAFSDMYSLGVLMYQLIAKELPIQAKSRGAFIAELFSSEPVSLASKVPEVSPALDALVMQCLSKEASDRPSANKLREKFEQNFPSCQRELLPF